MLKGGVARRLWLAKGTMRIGVGWGGISVRIEGATREKGAVGGEGGGGGVGRSDTS